MMRSVFMTFVKWASYFEPDRMRYLCLNTFINIVVRFDRYFPPLCWTTHGPRGGRGVWRKQTQACSNGAAQLIVTHRTHFAAEGEGHTYRSWVSVTRWSNEARCANGKWVILTEFRTQAYVKTASVPVISVLGVGTDCRSRGFTRNISVLFTEARLLLAGHTSKKGKSYSDRAAIMIAGSLKCCIYMELCVCVCVMIRRVSAAAAVSGHMAHTHKSRFNFGLEITSHCVRFPESSRHGQARLQGNASLYSVY